MRHKRALVSLLVGLIFGFPVHAIDEEQQSTPAAKPMLLKKHRFEVENELLKEEVETLKKQLRHEKDKDDIDVMRQKTRRRHLSKHHKKDKDVIADKQQLVEIEMVHLPVGIWMGKYEVTQGQWKAVMGNKNNHSKFGSCGDDCPVEQVSWDKVQGFIRTLNSQTGEHYRLPTEEEWYSACKAGYNNKYCGSDNINDVAWYEGNAGGITHSVGQKQPNAWGLYDMSGNVWEWTSGCSQGDCSRQVSLGGSWFDIPAGVRSTYRNRSANKDCSIGFRLVKDR
jgi:hypothetical protein